MIIAALFTHLFLSSGEVDMITAVCAVAGLASLFAFGPLMHRFPQWADRYSIHYMAYSSTFMTAFVGLLFIELHMLSAKNLLAAGVALLIVSLAIGLHSLCSVYGWVKRYRKRQARAAIASLAFTALLLAGLLIDSLHVY